MCRTRRADGHPRGNLQRHRVACHSAARGLGLRVEVLVPVRAPVVVEPRELGLLTGGPALQHQLHLRAGLAGVPAGRSGQVGALSVVPVEVHHVCRGRAGAHAHRRAEPLRDSGAFARCVVAVGDDIVEARHRQHARHARPGGEPHIGVGVADVPLPAITPIKGPAGRWRCGRSLRRVASGS